MTTSSFPVAQLLDTIGLDGPAVILKIRRTLATMTTGQRLEVWTDRSVAVRDIPSFCAHSEHRLLMAQQTGERLAVIIEKGRRDDTHADPIANDTEHRGPLSHQAGA